MLRLSSRSNRCARALTDVNREGQFRRMRRADLERLATAASLAGQDQRSVDLWTRVYHARARQGDAPRAARAVFWLALDLLNRGERAQASGWLARAQRLLEGARHDCAERGLLLVLVARVQLRGGDLRAAIESAATSAALASRFPDPDLRVFSRLITAQLKIFAGDVGSAATLFDEIMVSVTVDAVSPIAVGTVYCAVIEGCHTMGDIARAREWTAALSRWCATQRDVAPFGGICLVHRAEILRFSGAWPEAMDEAERAAASKGPLGAAYYEVGEIHRMRGQIARAETAYRQAAQCGRSPEPGLALLRLAQGRIAAAVASVRRLIEEPQRGVTRAQALGAAVEVMIVARDVPAARAAADQLAALAATTGTLGRALADEASGSVLLAEGSAAAALAPLRAAWMMWQELDAPYHGARVRVLLALACRALGDDEAARLELEAAARVFQRLEAAGDAARVAELLQTPVPGGAALTTRERQVIRLVASGRTNRAIADQLTISERTVDRHVSNILRKLDLTTRSAATAYAYDHGLV